MAEYPAIAVDVERILTDVAVENLARQRAVGELLHKGEVEDFAVDMVGGAPGLLRPRLSVTHFYGGLAEERIAGK